MEKMKIADLLFRYKQLLMNPPNVRYASNEELDMYYDELLDIEEEIKSRCI